MEKEKAKDCISNPYLNYKTRRDESPTGKPKVYFCCHAEDHKLYFYEISADLLRLQDCSIWYSTHQSEVVEEDFWFDLAQMSMFVIPVTHRFLTGSHSALEEFNFAIEHNIPVLPLMQEAGLDEQFNRVCGDLQYLNKGIVDATAI